MSLKRIGKILLIILIVFLILLAFNYFNHKFRLKKEDKLFVPLGDLVTIDGNQMSVYSEGVGNETIVFLSGGGTCSPILDFNSLFSLLSSEYKIVVVEKFGYGFSDVVDRSRDIDTILEDTRKALSLAGHKGPYILTPHSMSGIESLYWANKYPQEVKAIIGLDMAVPEAYGNMDINMPILQLGRVASSMGIIRLIPSVSESEAIKYGTLTDEEKDIYRAIFYRRTATTTMLNEMESIKENARIVKELSFENIPILLFVSNGQQTGYDNKTWISFQKRFADVNNATLRLLDVPHYIHNHAYKDISEDIKGFIIKLDD